MKYYYTYKGTQTIYLPTQGITTEPENPTKVYVVTEPINHPDFEEVKKKDKKNI